MLEENRKLDAMRFSRKQLIIAGSGVATVVLVVAVLLIDWSRFAPSSRADELREREAFRQASQAHPPLTIDIQAHANRKNLDERMRDMLRKAQR